MDVSMSEVQNDAENRNQPSINGVANDAETHINTVTDQSDDKCDITDRQLDNSIETRATDRPGEMEEVDAANNENDEKMTTFPGTVDDAEVENEERMSNVSSTVVRESEDTTEEPMSVLVSSESEECAGVRSESLSSPDDPSSAKKLPRQSKLCCGYV